MSRQYVVYGEMKLGILAIGNAKDGPEKQLWEMYLSRLPQRGSLIEFDTKFPAGPQRTKDESSKIMSWFDEKAPKGARLVCLDPYGKDASSEGLAKLLVRWRDDSIPATYFAIGGADGHHPDLLARADQKLAFGSATWPHMLFRAMLAEQLYRAEMISTGHPYHRS